MKILENYSTNFRKIEYIKDAIDLADKANESDNMSSEMVNAINEMYVAADAVIAAYDSLNK